jgi:hypothetical protein
MIDAQHRFRAVTATLTALTFLFCRLYLPTSHGLRMERTAGRTEKAASSEACYETSGWSMLQRHHNFWLTQDIVT